MQISSVRRDLILRWVCALPLTLAAAVLTMASTPLWFPKGVAGIDHLIFAIMLFPAFWAIYVFYALIEPKPVRGFIVMMIAIAANAWLVYRQF